MQVQSQPQTTVEVWNQTSYLRDMTRQVVVARQAPPEKGESSK